MNDDITILVGTSGYGVLRSADSGATWPRVKGVPLDTTVRVLAGAPSRPKVVFAGTNWGVMRSDDAGASWRLLPSWPAGATPWALAVDPSDENVVYVATGTPTPPAVYRSADGGHT